MQTVQCAVSVLHADDNAGMIPILRHLFGYAPEMPSAASTCFQFSSNQLHVRTGEPTTHVFACPATFNCLQMP
jgi:hypothetical protein